MTKYKKYFQQMMDENEALFLQFKEVHDGYKSDRKTWSQKFHSQGKEVVDIMREWEQRLCSSMERGHNAVFSSKLSEKFWAEVKLMYSHIDLVGVKSNLD